MALVAIAGALGTVTRYGMVEISNRLFGASFPWGHWWLTWPDVLPWA
jgi:fluoride ion exporter CrcB/FEX